MFCVTFFASLSVLCLAAASGKKAKTKSDLTVLVETQNRWKAFWNKASVDVAVNNCKRDCGWKELKEEESNLRSETVELVIRQPQFEASLAEFLALSSRGASPKEHGARCHAPEAKDRDDYCVCAHENGVPDWQTHCSKSNDKQNCQFFLHNMCGFEFSEAQEEDLDDFEDLEDTEERLHNHGKKADIGEVQKEATSQTEEQLLRLQAAMANLDDERKQLYEVHAETTKGKEKSSRPLLSNLDQRIKRQKDKILRDMEAIINRREQEVIKEKQEADRGQEEYQKRLQRLLESEKDINI